MSQPLAITNTQHGAPQFPTARQERPAGTCSLSYTDHNKCVVKSTIKLSTLSGLFIYILDFGTIFQESKSYLLAARLFPNLKR